MRNQLQNGEAVSVVTPSGGFTSGQGAQIGASLFGVAALTCAACATGVLWFKGVYSLAKTSAQQWAVGDPIYWDDSNHRCDNVSSAGTRIGVATAIAANPSSVGEVRLDGQMLTSATAATVGGMGSNYTIARGQHAQLSATDTIVTGLTTVLSAVASLETTPAAAHAFRAADIGDQAGTPVAGSIIIKTFTAAYSAELTPGGTVVNWIAVGVN